jgi:uncharacterized protein YlxW (UPF0749 family)
MEVQSIVWRKRGRQPGLRRIRLLTMQVACGIVEWAHFLPCSGVKKAERRSKVTNAYFWLVIGFLVIALTKYLTSVRLRTLAERAQRDQQESTELRYVLVEAEEKETKLKAETESLQAKLTALRNVVSNLQRSIQRGKRASVAAPVDA